MTALGAVAAFPTSFLLVWVLLRSRVAHGLGRRPDSSRWRAVATPLVGGVAIYAGLTVGLLLSLLGPLDLNKQLIGIFAGASLLFLAGLIDDIRTLPPLAKLTAQLGAAAIVLSTGTTVERFSAWWIAIPLGVTWLVGMTNAFNLLDNMDGLAGSLAVIASGFFALSAWIAGGQPQVPGKQPLVLVLSIALALAVAGFLPFNLRPGRRALAWMGDSGSQLIGFTLASLGMASSYVVASSTVATLLLPVLVLAVPILDTTLVTIVRLLDGRPVSHGGHDHSSHRLVSLGVSETGAVVLLALVSATLGGTSLAYEAFDNGRVATFGVLVSFALLIQLGSFLADFDRRRRGHIYVRRIGEVVVDGALISASFLAAYLLRFEGTGTVNQRHVFLLTLPVLLFCRYVALLLLRMYAGVWRYASVRDALRVVTAVAVSGVAALGFVVLTHGGLGDFSRSVFVIDALICSIALTASRFAERAIVHAIELARSSTVRRVLIVGAGRGGRSLLRELRETPGERIVGFIDDDPGLRGRRLDGVRVFGGVQTIETALERSKPDIVLITIPDAPSETLRSIIVACDVREIPCRLARREIDIDPRTLLEPRTR